jgi:hypothetical protein
MKKMMIALLLLVAFSSMASAQVPFIGMYADDQAVICHTDLAVYVATSVYFIADIGAIPAITAAEFSVSNLPGAADALITPNWATPLVIGDAGYGIALAFSPAVPGPMAFLGTLDFFALVDLGADYVMEVLPSNDSGLLVVVDDNYNTIDADGGMFTFNCSTGDCLCVEGVATDDATISSIKALY